MRNVNRRLFFPLFFAALFLLSACSDELPTPSPTFVAPDQPTVTLMSPANGTVLPSSQPVTVTANIQSSRGILRADLIVDGVVVATQPLVVTSRQFVFRANWHPSSMGQHTITVVGYDVSSFPGASATIQITISGDSGLAPNNTSPTPWIIVVTSTPIIPPTNTPPNSVIIVTNTPVPPAPPSPTPFFQVVTNTPALPPRATHTPIIVVVTPSP